MSLAHGSLFSGIGGTCLAIEGALGTDTIWHVEYDKACQEVLASHWPGVPCYGDVTTLDFTELAPVDVLSASYPCQPFSHAGKRKGTNDDRHLWPYVAGAIRVLRPRLVVLENVAGHLSLGFDEVLCDLAKMGFDAEWGIVRASDVGAPHRRERLFIVAHPSKPERRDPKHDRVGTSIGPATELGERSGSRSSGPVAPYSHSPRLEGHRGLHLPRQVDPAPRDSATRRGTMGYLRTRNRQVGSRPRTTSARTHRREAATQPRFRSVDDGPTRELAPRDTHSATQAMRQRRGPAAGRIRAQGAGEPVQRCRGGGVTCEHLGTPERDVDRRRLRVLAKPRNNKAVGRDYHHDGDHPRSDLVRLLVEAHGSQSGQRIGEPTAIVHC